MADNELIARILAALDTPVSLFLLYLIVRDLLKELSESRRTLHDVIDRLSVSYGEELQTRRLQDYASKHRDTRDH